MIVIGDVHGCIKTLKALIAKLPDEEICFSGDLIDRGPNSREVIEFVREHNYHVVRGNHEEMMINNCDSKKGFFNIWHNNGGLRCVHNYIGENELFKEHVEWMKTLPYYKEFPDCKDENGRYLVVSHSHICNVWDRIKDASESDLSMLNDEILWGRPFELKELQDIFNIIGHTPVGDVKFGISHSNVDTGCVFGVTTNVDPKTGQYNERFGKLTAISFPSMEIWQQEMIDIE